MKLNDIHGTSGKFVIPNTARTTGHKARNTPANYSSRECQHDTRAFHKNHDDVVQWKHWFSALLAICAGNSPVSGEFPAQRPVTRSLTISLICVWINGWVNDREAGDLIRYHAHYDFTVLRVQFDILKEGTMVKHRQGGVYQFQTHQYNRCRKLA